MSGTSAMSGMPSTFTVNTRVTLWFTGWTTTTTAAYVSSLFFIFILGLFSRLLGALKSQLGRRWREKQDIVRASSDVFNVEKVDRHDFHHRSRKWYHAFSTRPSRPEGEQQQHEIEPLSPTTQGAQAMGEDVEGSRQQRRRPWTACAPWNVKKNGINAILEVVQSLIGYLLMLAVMTYNVGFLIAVMGSVLVGELMFGRYTDGSPRLAEAACHS